MLTYFESSWIINFFGELAENSSLCVAPQLHATFDHTLNYLEHNIV